jgi:hypothetical protein
MASTPRVAASSWASIVPPEIALRKTDVVARRWRSMSAAAKRLVERQ